MGAKKFSHTHRLTMCGLKKLASGVFPESWKVLAERRRQRRWWKRTKNNKSPCYPGGLNKINIAHADNLAQQNSWYQKARYFYQFQQTHSSPGIGLQNTRLISDHNKIAHISRQHNCVCTCWSSSDNTWDSEITASCFIYPLKLKMDSSATNYLHPTHLKISNKYKHQWWDPFPVLWDP